VPSGITVQGAKKDTKGSRKRQKQRPEWVAAVANYYDDKKADDSNMEYVATVGGSVKRQVGRPTNHFERLLEEACPNNVHPIKHKLRDCGMMKNFMTLGSLT
jgi:hypothetical protein